jgi:hypothetical protein
MIFTCWDPIHGQCNQRLVDRAAQEAGPDAIYLRDFKVKLSGGTMENPSPLGRFPVFLNEGASYRFTIASDEFAEGFAVLQLQRKDKVLGSTCDPEDSSHNGSFDFECSESATYQVLISFHEGLPGCAAGVISLVLQDSMKVIEPGIATSSDSSGTLYLFVQNEMNIAATGIPGGYLEVRISNGSIERSGRHYIAQPAERGETVVYVKAFRKNGEMSEKDSLIYFADYPPLPQLILPGMHGNVLKKNHMTGANRIEFYFYRNGMEKVYELVEFTLSVDKSSHVRLSSAGNYLTQQQIDLIRSVPSGDKLYITNATFLDPDGKKHIAPIHEIWVEE